MEFNYTEEELAHSEILEKVAQRCHSTKRSFVEGETEKLTAIRQLLTDSGYREILLPGVQLWRKNLEAPIDVLVSSHADYVSAITKPFSELSDDGYYKGTYDNAGTTGAAVIAMLKGEIGDNVTFAFTSDEETGHCNGANQALEYALSTRNNPVCIALDVTYEGYDEGELFTVENLSSGEKKEDKEFLNAVGSAMLNLEPDGKKTCSFVRLNKKAIPDNLPQKYISKDNGWFDEAQFYANQKMRTFSLCLPSVGNMHDNSGLTVRQPGFEGYINALEAMIYSFSLDKDKTMDEIEKRKTLNEVLFDKTQEMVEEEEKKAAAYRAAHPKKHSYYGGYSQRSWLDEATPSDESYWNYLQHNIPAYKPIVQYDDILDIPYPEEYAESWYSEAVFEDFQEYIDTVIDSLAEDAADYEMFYKTGFIETVEAYVPEDFVKWYGGAERARVVIAKIFDEVHRDDYDIDAEDDLPKAKSAYVDVDGFEYELKGEQDDNHKFRRTV